MKINIGNIFTKNILNKFEQMHGNEFDSSFSLKEREFWFFTSDLIKDNYPIKEYDSIKDKKYLSEYLELYLLQDGVTKFTIDEWFQYLKSKE